MALSSRINFLQSNFTKLYRQLNLISSINLRQCSSRVSATDEFCGNKVEEFKNEKVQHLLKRLTGLDVEKIFATRKEVLNKPEYRLLDDKELLQAEEDTKKEAMKRLAPSTVMTQRKPMDKILSHDKEIANHDQSNFVFTDISSSKSVRDRRVVVRQPDGVLREATWDERDRMEYIYYPAEGQYYELPPLLKDEYLKNSFDQKRYSHLLDMVILQCQPDAPDYIRVHEATYEMINRHGDFECLRSTRHFPGLVFHLIKNNRIENVFKYLVQGKQNDDLDDFVSLYAILHPQSDFADNMNTQDKGLQTQQKVEVFTRYVCPEMLSSIKSLFNEEKKLDTL